VKPIFTFVFLFLLTATTSLAAEPVAAPSPWGMNYFSFWEGNSLDDGKRARNEKGGPLDDGLQLFNLISNTYKITDKYSIDLQTRLEHIPITFNGDTKNKNPTRPSWRFQGLRIGISGKLAAGEKWSLRGAFNTDIPELNGRDARFRTTIFNPGLFTGLNVQFNDRWSLYAILSPRVFFYRDDEAVEPEWTAGDRRPGQKPRLILQAAPSINYAINDTTGIRGGLDLSFRQFVESDTMYLKRWPTSASVGPTFILGKHMTIFPYVQTWPFDGKKMTMETTSYGAWINGVIF
jgi:hypothetical protein